MEKMKGAVRNFVLLFVGLAGLGLCACKDEPTKEKETFVFEDTVGGVVLTEYNGDEEEIVVPSEYNGKAVVKVGDYVFANADGLKKVVLGDGLQALGDGVFSGCVDLEEVSFCDTLVSLGNSVFKACESLTEIALPKSVLSVGENVFSGCFSLTEMTVPFVSNERKTSGDLKQYPFGYWFGADNYYGGARTVQNYYDSSLIDPNVASFYIPRNLKKVQVLDGEILYGAFSGCCYLEEIILPDKTESVASKAFFGCTALTGNFLTGSGWYLATPSNPNAVFYKAYPALSGIVLSSNTSFIYESAFDGCSQIRFTKKNGGNYVGTYENETFALVGVDDVSIEKLTVEDGTKQILKRACYNLENLETLVLPSSLQYIGEEAFEYDEKLHGVLLPEKVKQIDRDAFYGCKQLWEVRNESSLDVEKGSGANGRVGYYAVSVHTGESAYGQDGEFSYLVSGDDVYFTGYTGYDDAITLPNVLNGKEYFIAPYAFMKDESLSITLSKTLGIGRYAFVGCTADLDLKETGLETLGEYVFGGYLGETVVLPKTLKTLGDYAFDASKNLKTLDLGEAVETVGKFALYGCTALKELVLPKSVRHIEINAFPYEYVLSDVLGEYTVNVVEKLYYLGTEEEFLKIEFCSGYALPERTNVYYYSETERGLKNWHYDGGKPSLYE